MAIAVNGTGIATIRLAGLDLVDVSVHGALDREQKAALHAIGGNYAEGGCGHLIWIAEHGLLPGDVVSVRLRDECDAATRGKTIAELYPDAVQSAKTDFSMTDDLAKEIRARPRLHAGFVAQVETSSAQIATAASDDVVTDFAFSVLWDRFQPDQVRLRFASYCLDDVIARTGGKVHLTTMLSVGDSVELRLLQ